MKKTKYLPGLHLLCGRAKLLPSQRLKNRLDAVRLENLGQLETIFGPEVSLPRASGYRSAFSRVTTFWTFLEQVLGHGSCRDATRLVQARREALGRSSISSANVAYCKARARLPLAWIEDQARGVAANLQASARWDWRGRRVLLADATSCQLADTPENQAAYPQPGSQQPGCGQPVMQLLGLFDLGSGALLGWEKSQWNVGETCLFEAAVAAHVGQGDVLVADRAYDGYYCYGLLKMSGADAVVRMNKRRNCPLKKGHSEAFATLQRPRQHKRPKHYSKEQWLAMPERIHVRLVRVNLARPGFRSTEVTLVTTILDAPAQAIAELYLRRWQIEVCFRDIKTTLGMELLRGKSPAIVQREVAMHLLAYNLLRTLMLQAAQQENQPLYAMSFAGARDATQRFAPIIANSSTKSKRKRAIKELLRCIGTDTIPRRPNRSEPRVLKRRPKSYQRLNKKRNLMKVSPSKRIK